MSDSDNFDVIVMDRMEVQHMLDELTLNREVIAAQRATYIQERETTTAKFARLERQLHVLQSEVDAAVEVASFCIALIEAVEFDQQYTHHQKKMIFSLLKHEMRKINPEDASDIPF